MADKPPSEYGHLPFAPPLKLRRHAVGRGGGMRGGAEVIKYLVEITALLRLNEINPRLKYCVSLYFNVL